MNAKNVQVAYQAIRKAMGISNIPGTKILKIIKIRNALAEIAEAVTQRERNIVEKYADSDENGKLILKNGIISVSDKIKEKEAEAELLELYQEEYDLSEIKGYLDIKESEMYSNFPLCGNDIDTLGYFISFGG